MDKFISRVSGPSTQWQKPLKTTQYIDNEISDTELQELIYKKVVKLYFLMDNMNKQARVTEQELRTKLDSIKKSVIFPYIFCKNY